MEIIFTKIIEVSPFMGVFLVIWFYQRKDDKEQKDKQREDYTKLVQDINDQHKTREKEMQDTIKENNKIIQENQKIISESQNIIHSITEKMSVIEVVNKKVDTLENKVEKIIDKIDNK